jgi:hypothetical protein
MRYVGAFVIEANEEMIEKIKEKIQGKGERDMILSISW